MTASIVIVGPQGCGKTLNGKALALAFGLPHWCEADGRRRLPRTDHLILANDLDVPPGAWGLKVVQFSDAIRRVPNPHPASPGVGRGAS